MIMRRCWIGWRGGGDNVGIDWEWRIGLANMGDHRHHDPDRRAALANLVLAVFGWQGEL